VFLFPQMKEQKERDFRKEQRQQSLTYFYKQGTETIQFF